MKQVIVEKRIRSIALPPLGTGNGGLDWRDVRPRIEAALGSLPNVEVTVFEPTSKYQNVAKRAGLEKLTPARALIAELVRRYWVLGFECSVLEIQKLAYFLEQSIEGHQIDNASNAGRYGFASGVVKYAANLSFFAVSNQIASSGIASANRLLQCK